MHRVVQRISVIVNTYIGQTDWHFVPRDNPIEGLAGWNEGMTDVTDV
jgi:hypothetical protein